MGVLNLKKWRKASLLLDKMGEMRIIGKHC